MGATTGSVSAYCRKGDPFQGLKVGSCLTLRNELSKETHVLTKQEILLGRGTQWRAEGKEPRRTGLPHGSQSRVLWWWDSFRVVFSQSFWLESFLVAQASLSQDGCQREGFWEVIRHVASPFDLSQTLPVGGGLLVPCSLPGPPVVKQLMQMVTRVPGQDGRFQSACFP